MRALIVADPHLDAWAGGLAPHPLDTLAPEILEGLDLVIVAGDLADRGQDRWRGALAWLAQRLGGAKLHVIPGNHDFYGGALDQEGRLAAQAEAAGAAFAQKAEIVTPGRRFLCCTLWTDRALGGDPRVNARHTETGMQDYRLIRVAGEGYRRLRAADTVALHHEHRCWLEARLATPFAGDTVVVTHHAPHPGCLGPFEGGSLDAAYASDLTELIAAHRPTLWLHGHTHVPMEVAVGATVIRCVSIGYPPGVIPGQPIGDPRAGLLDW